MDNMTGEHRHVLRQIMLNTCYKEGDITLEGFDLENSRCVYYVCDTHGGVAISYRFDHADNDIPDRILCPEDECPGTLIRRGT
jgi:hypothetical protein